MVRRKPGQCLQLCRKLPRPRTSNPDSNNAHNGNNKCYRHCKYLLSVILLSAPVNAEGIGGISATASPTATSSGSVSNQAVQILQGNSITNSYGNNIQCQGPTLTTSVYGNRTKSWNLPYEYAYDDPVYDLTDIDDDGRLDNPGEVYFYKDTRTGQKDTHNYNFGVSIQATMPLDGGLQERCKEAAETQIALQKQILANKRLDFELSRAKVCAQLLKEGVRFAKKSPYAKVCADIQIYQPVPHTHPISVKPAAAVSAGKEPAP